MVYLKKVPIVELVQEVLVRPLLHTCVRSELDWLFLRESRFDDYKNLQIAQELRMRKGLREPDHPLVMCPDDLLAVFAQPWASNFQRF